MNVTKEQQAAINIIKNTDEKLIKIEAVSGSGKTTTLTNIAKEYKPTRGLYIAYNKAIATEAQGKFPKEMKCMTTHSMAYQATVKPYNLKVGFFSYRDVKEKIPYDHKLQVVNHIRDFCLSEYTSFIDYSKTTKINNKIIPICENTLADMASGKIMCTHDFYLKLFHILLENDDIKIKPYDLVMLDECVVAHTGIKTENGVRSIAELYRDQERGKHLPKVKSYNKNLKKFEYKEILKVYKNGIKQTYITETSNKIRLKSTNNHKILTQRGYVEVKNLIPYKDYIISDIEKYKNYVISVVKDKKLPVFDLTVKDNHNYITTSTHGTDKSAGLIVHNCGDLNNVTLKIFNKLPTKKRVMVGDFNQNIYSFNNTINGFEVMKDVGITLKLTQSFRVADYLAKPIETFCRDTFNPKMEFKGIKYKNKTVENKAFISRTNGVLIDKMIKLNSKGIKYNLVRPVKSIFTLPIILMSLRKGGFVSDPQYKYLQADIDDYYNDEHLQNIYKSQLKYIMAIHKEDIQIKSAINILMKYGPDNLIEAKKIAEKYEKSKEKCNYILCTGHSSKGLEFSSVEIGDDFNNIIDKILKKPKDAWSNEDYEEFRLYYVATTRAKIELINATHIEKYMD